MATDTDPDEGFDLVDFLPYLLNQAAEASSLDFQRVYKSRYGMLRTEWRVLFHLGRYGDLTAREICERARLHKTKISRAVKALEDRRFLERTEQEHDRRNETLSLTTAGRRAYIDLRSCARDHDKRITDRFSPEDQRILRKCLRQLANL